MTYEDFEKFVREQCMYETIYDDSDGRRILVMRLLDAYGMVNKAVAEEREACAKVLDEMAAKDKLTNYYTVAALVIRARGQE